MSPTPDLLRGFVVALLLVATGYHVTRLFRRPLLGLDGAHALMGGVMLLMLAGWTGDSPGLGWAAVFVVVGIAGMFSRHRVELVIGSVAMVFMLVAPTPGIMTTRATSGTGPASAADRIAAMPGMQGMAGMHGAADVGHVQAATSSAMSSAMSSAQLLTLLLVVALVPALVAVVAGSLLRTRTEPGTTSGMSASRVSIACRVGLNLAAVYMLVMMV